MITDNKITEIFYLVDEFNEFFKSTLNSHSISDGKKHRNKPSKLTDSEVIVILLLFHFGGFRCFKHYYINYIQKYRTDLFPQTVSYNRFVELESKVALMMGVFIKNVYLPNALAYRLLIQLQSLYVEINVFIATKHFLV